MAKSYSSDEDALQPDSDAGESQVSGSTPTGSDIEDEEPQAKEEEPQEEAKKNPSSSQYTQQSGTSKHGDDQPTEKDNVAKSSRYHRSLFTVTARRDLHSRSRGGPR
jgi:multidrug efflux pump subunit AcrB